MGAMGMNSLDDFEDDFEVVLPEGKKPKAKKERRGSKRRGSKIRGSKTKGIAVDGPPSDELD